MVYEWDSAKREENIRKHGFDFIRAPRIHEAPFKVVLETVRGGEKRFIDLAEIDGVIVMLVYTMRGKTVRCISMRLAKRRERRFFHAALEGHPTDE